MDIKSEIAYIIDRELLEGLSVVNPDVPLVRAKKDVVVNQFQSLNRRVIPDYQRLWDWHLKALGGRASWWPG